MTMILKALEIMLIVELVAFLVLWSIMWTRYRRPSTPWYRFVDSSSRSLAWSESLYLPAVARVRTHANRVRWLLGATLLGIVVLAFAGGSIGVVR